MIAKITNLVKRHQRDIFLAVCLILVAGIGYNLGRLSGPQKQSGEADTEAASMVAAVPVKNTPAPRTDTRVVASKNSKSKLYHYTWCPGAQKIKEQNKVWFNTASAAETAGYSLAGNCN